MKNETSNNQWIERILENCEAVGIPKATIKRFVKYSLKDRGYYNE